MGGLTGMGIYFRTEATPKLDCMKLRAFNETIQKLCHMCHKMCHDESMMFSFPFLVTIVKYRQATRAVESIVFKPTRNKKS